jgi:taurine dioxygenase
MTRQENRTNSLHPLRPAPLTDAAFGAVLDVSDQDPDAAADAVLGDAAALVRAFHDAGGLLVLRGLTALKDRPRDLVRLSRAFGPEVEDIRETLTAPRFFHPDVAEIMVLSNKPGHDHPPPPEPPGGRGGPLPIRFPDRANWHTDQSYRRPPPDVSLLSCVTAPPPDQGRTLYADCTAAYAALDASTRARIDGLEGLHAMGWIGRGAADVRAGVSPKPLLDHQRPVRQPLVRRHPVTGNPALYICEEKQMDHVDGPVVGLEPGPDGAGARLIRDLLRHATHPRFVYVHRWRAGDVVIGDNRCLLHAASWYDAAAHEREMWRTTVMGDPGPAYAGEAKSWLPPAGVAVMAGLEDA